MSFVLNACTASKAYIVLTGGCYQPMWRIHPKAARMVCSPGPGPTSSSSMKLATRVSLRAPSSCSQTCLRAMSCLDTGAPQKPHQKPPLKPRLLKSLVSNRGSKSFESGPGYRIQVNRRMRFLWVTLRARREPPPPPATSERLVGRAKDPQRTKDFCLPIEKRHSREMVTVSTVLNMLNVRRGSVSTSRLAR